MTEAYMSELYNFDMKDYEENMGGFFIYFIQCGNKRGHVKIGYSEEPTKRAKDLQVGNPNKLRVVFFIRVIEREDARQIERIIHKSFDSHRVRGEWFSREVLTEEANKVICQILLDYENRP